MSKSLMNQLYIKQKVYGLKMAESSELIQHINKFNQVLEDLQYLDVKYQKDNKLFMLLNSLPESYENLATTLMWGKDHLELEEVTDSREPC